MIQQKKATDLHEIAESVAKQFDRPASDLKKKRYNYGSNLFEMKKEFVRQAYNHRTNAEIARYLDHTRSNVSRIHKRAVKDKKFKYEKILSHMRNNGLVTKHDFTKLNSHISELRKKGYHIYFDKYGYRLAER